MSPEPERALVGLEDIRAFLETLWRRRRNMHAQVTRSSVQRHLRRHALPAERLGEGPWIAKPSEVEAWFEKRLQVSSTTHPSGTNGQIGLFPAPPR